MDALSSSPLRSSATLTIDQKVEAEMTRLLYRAMAHAVPGGRDRVGFGLGRRGLALFRFGTPPNCTMPICGNSGL